MTTGRSGRGPPQHKGGRVLIEEIVDGLDMRASVYLKRIPGPENALREFNSRRQADAFLSVSENLRDVAGDVRKRSTELRADGNTLVSLMLEAMSLENAMKAVALSRVTQPPSEADYKRIIGFGHDLAGLAHEIGMTAGPRRSAALEAMREYIQWSARYPVPKSVARYKDSEAEHGIDPPIIWEEARSIREELMGHVPHPQSVAPTSLVRPG